MTPINHDGEEADYGPNSEHNRRSTLRVSTDPQRAGYSRLQEKNDDDLVSPGQLKGHHCEVCDVFVAVGGGRLTYHLKTPEHKNKERKQGIDCPCDDGWSSKRDFDKHNCPDHQPKRPEKRGWGSDEIDYPPCSSEDQPLDHYAYENPAKRHREDESISAFNPTRQQGTGPRISGSNAIPLGERRKRTNAIVPKEKPALFTEETQKQEHSKPIVNRKQERSSPMDGMKDSWKKPHDYWKEPSDQQTSTPRSYRNRSKEPYARSRDVEGSETPRISSRTSSRQSSYRRSSTRKAPSPSPPRDRNYRW